MRTPHEIVIEISRLVALTLSPTVIVFDQVDRFFDRTSTAMFDQDQALEEAEAKRLGPVAEGLMTLRDDTQRTLVVVSCLPDVWALLTKSVPSTFVDRFRPAYLPDRIATPNIAKAIVAKRFAYAFDVQHFSPPYPTWPIREDAFEEAVELTPRQLLRRVEAHIKTCLDNEGVIELAHLLGEPSIQIQSGTEPGIGTDLDALDKRFNDLFAMADVRAALDPHSEDKHMPELLAAGLAAWVDEQAPTGKTYKVEPQSGTKPTLHGRLIEVLDETMETEACWAFRAIASQNAIAVISRVRAAVTSAGLNAEAPHRRLVVLRNASSWPSGARTKEVTDAFAAAGGILHRIAEHDLRTFAALLGMRAHPHPRLAEWLAKRRHASDTELLRDILGNGGDKPGKPSGGPSIPPRATGSTRSLGGEGHGPDIGLGSTMGDGAAFNVGLESLRRHCVIFAGSGSGKTVLIRRLVEECARQGVSAIVLDPNSDLARLGDAWPDPPSAWGPGDAERARDYLDNTDVVIWTPGVSGGRPLTFQPLPDFRPLRDFPDEFDQAIRSTVEALAPRAGIRGGTRQAQQAKAVLTEALLTYAKAGHVGLGGFTEFLADLPDGVSRMARASKLAHDLAETLKAAMINDPLFGGEGTAADPGELLNPPPGKRARVSVISFVGLNSDDEKQSFVNQLQMALFAWIKRNPAGERPLGGLFVMDEAQTLAPSTGSTPSTASTISLASQARKYGLGLVFATQAPKGLHNQISGNATTQFFGLLNAPAQIDAARDLARAKGGALPDIGLLTSGQFYATGEGFSFVKVKTPLCLTYHPKAPLTPEEVIERARAKRIGTSGER